MPSDLLSDIREFLAETRMGPSYFGKLAVGNSELVARLEAGNTVTLRTAEAVRNFIAASRARRRTSPAAGMAVPETGEDAA